ncbi:hypothetical protein HII31_04456 [Pseudocercospora fuligena]|uniref:Uncharacterized protein n=1 Tax=Pseudocercospora fuligena TaxID=685502 RepID=A0A8H6VN30_9PEZI|nr:hypothetical protein HII31_04456 [Pseudocercospora fuligena]
MAVLPQDLPHQAEACKGAEAEPPNSSVDPPQNWQHHPVRYPSDMRGEKERQSPRRVEMSTEEHSLTRPQLQRQEETLAQDSHWYLNYSPLPPNITQRHELRQCHHQPWLRPRVPLEPGV